MPLDPLAEGLDFASRLLLAGGEQVPPLERAEERVQLAALAVEVLLELVHRGDHRVEAGELAGGLVEPDFLVLVEHLCDRGLHHLHHNHPLDDVRDDAVHLLAPRFGGVLPGGESVDEGRAELVGQLVGRVADDPFGQVAEQLPHFGPELPDFLLVLLDFALVLALVLVLLGHQLDVQLGHLRGHAPHLVLRRSELLAAQLVRDRIVERGVGGHHVAGCLLVVAQGVGHALAHAELPVSEPFDVYAVEVLRGAELPIPLGDVPDRFVHLQGRGVVAFPFELIRAARRILLDPLHLFGVAEQPRDGRGDLEGGRDDRQDDRGGLHRLHRGGRALADAFDRAAHRGDRPT